MRCVCGPIPLHCENEGGWGSIAPVGDYASPVATGRAGLVIHSLQEPESRHGKPRPAVAAACCTPDAPARIAQEMAARWEYPSLACPYQGHTGGQQAPESTNPPFQSTPRPAIADPAGYRWRSAIMQLRRVYSGVVAAMLLVAGIGAACSGGQSPAETGRATQGAGTASPAPTETATAMPTLTPPATPTPTQTPTPIPTATPVPTPAPFTGTTSEGRPVTLRLNAAGDLVQAEIGVMVPQNCSGGGLQFLPQPALRMTVTERPASGPSFSYLLNGMVEEDRRYVATFSLIEPAAVQGGRFSTPALIGSFTSESAASGSLVLFASPGSSISPPEGVRAMIVPGPPGSVPAHCFREPVRVSWTAQR